MAISLLLKHDAGMLDVPNPRGATALFVASFEGHAAAVTLLLNAGAAVDRSKSDGATPLAGACHSGRATAMSRDCTAWGGGMVLCLLRVALELISQTRFGPKSDTQTMAVCLSRWPNFFWITAQQLLCTGSATCNFLHFPHFPILCNFRKTRNHQLSSHVASVHAASLAHFVVLRRTTKCNSFQTLIPGPGHVLWSDATLPGMQRWAHRRSEAASQAWGECLRLGCFSHLVRT